MRPNHLATLAIVLAAPLLAAAGPGRGDDRTAHGGFTGEVKPVLFVKDVQGSAPFYRDALGFELLSYAGSKEDPYYAELSAGGSKLGLHEPTSPGQATRIGQARIYLRVKDLERHRARVAAWGAEPGPVVKTDWMDFFIARDPDGNEIAFAVTDPDRHSIDPW